MWVSRVLLAKHFPYQVKRAYDIYGCLPRKINVGVGLSNETKMCECFSILYIYIYIYIYIV